jgi:dolichyl-phosphate beta-glucosyltransferase
LEDVRKYIDGIGMSAEILIVDDGSKDGTADVVERVAGEDSRVRLIRQVSNQGKGAAVKRGMLEAKGKFAIYADADGATPITELDKFIPLMMENATIIIGSRKASSDEVDRSRKGIRALMGIFFYKIVNFFAVPGIQDTQCGFKMFRCDVARKIFSRAAENGWAFDVELLYIAQLLGYSIHEVPVNWHEVEGSKVNPLKDSLKMLVAIFRIRSVHGGFLNNS